MTAWPTHRLAARAPLALFAVTTFAVGALWALATPVMGVPDEPAHVRKAAGVVRGQLIGHTMRYEGRIVEAVRIPQSLGVLGACVFGDFPPECDAMRASGRGDVLIDVESRASKYDPAYYAVVGIPTLVRPGRDTVYLMRLVTVLLATTFLTMAVASLLEVPAPRWGVLGLLVSLTPMTLFLVGSVNPNAVEITAAVGLWATLLVWFRAPDPRRDAARGLRVAVLASALLLTRPLSPLFLVLITTGAALGSPSSALREVARRPSGRVAAAVTGAALCAAMAWTLSAGSLVAARTEYPEYENVSRYLFDVLKSLSGYERQMIGVLGWVDTPLQEHVYLAWFALLGFLVIGAFAVGTTRTRLLLVLLGAASVVLPIVVQYPSAPELGLFWQGRYLLPLMVGLPLVAGLALGASHGWNALLSGGWSKGLMLSIVGVAHVSSFWWALHRNVIGYSEKWIGFTPRWQPPLGWIPLTIAYIAAICAWLGTVGWLADRSRPDATSPAGVPVRTRDSERVSGAPEARPAP